MPDNEGHLVAEPTCAECGRSTARVELVPPHDLPAQWDAWSTAQHEDYGRFHDATKWRFLYRGPGGNNGLGDDMTQAEAALYAKAFVLPLAFEGVRSADLHDNAGYCVRCQKPYCEGHWKISASGGGQCPQGHFASLDPHWAGTDDD